MTKEDLVRKVARMSGVTKDEATVVINATFAAIKAGLVNGEKLCIRDFCVFDIVHQKARISRNLRENTKVAVPARSAVKIKACPALQRAVRESLPV